MTVSTQVAVGIGTNPERAAGAVDPPTLRTPQELAGIVQVFASSVHWLERVRLRNDRRWYERLYHGSDYDVWVISWMPGQSTGFHDHGDSAGAFLVATGTLEEHRPGEPCRALASGDFSAFGPDYAHDVRNVSQAPSISIHAYSPPLSDMNQYELEGGRLLRRTINPCGSGISDGGWDTPRQESESRIGTQSIDAMLAAARAQLKRLSCRDAFKALANANAVLVDIRPESQRAREGYIPGALVVDRNVLEWRFDPTSSARLPVATSHDLQIIVFCSEGYTSSLAAAALQDLGLWRATDIIGGVKAWQEEGLPLVSSAGA